jgi:hypothetical protein
LEIALVASPFAQVIPCLDGLLCHDVPDHLDKLLLGLGIGMLFV